MYGAFVCDRVAIGSNCKIAGFVCDAARIDNFATSMGSLVHEYTQPEIEWGLDETPPQVEPCAVIGYGAVVVGGVTVGRNSYVAANAIVTKDVPPRTLARGVNEFIPAHELHASKISQRFWDWAPDLQ